VNDTFDAMLADYAATVTSGDWTAAQERLSEIQRFERSLVADYRSSGEDRGERESLIRSLEQAAQGDLVAAFFHLYDATLDSDDVTLATRIALAQLLETEGELVLAAAMFERSGLFQELDELLLHLRIDRALLANRVSELGVQHFEAVIREHPDDADAATELAGHLRAVGQDPEAMEACRHALRADPRAEDAALLLAELHAEQERPKRALEVLEAALVASPGSAELWAALGEHVESEEPELALEHFERALVQSARQPRALQGKRRALRELERWDELAAHLERSLEVLDDVDGGLRRELRSVYREHLKQPDKAEADEKKVARERRREQREIDEHIAAYAEAHKGDVPEPGPGSPLWILVAILGVLGVLALLAGLRD
jgi:tetratricopeptide (TPR) repeat protein